MNCHIGRDKGKSERVERLESLHTACGPIGYLGSAKNLHVKLSSAIEHTNKYTQMNNPLFTHIVMTMIMMIMTIILMMMILIINNTFHNFNEVSLIN